MTLQQRLEPVRSSTALPDFDSRYTGPEMMDDAEVSTEALRRALDELPLINRWLGGYRATLKTLEAFRRARLPGSLTILDVGAGAGDYGVRMVEWGLRTGIDIQVTALDLNPTTVGHARDRAEEGLPAAVRDRISFAEGDALDTCFPDASFDVCTAALFLHHMSDFDAIRLLQEMARVARSGIVINDIHRHPVAYFGAKVVTVGLQFGEMVRHDAPVSVLRSFRRAELRRISMSAGLVNARIRWQWAFRWVLTTLPQG